MKKILLLFLVFLANVSCVQEQDLRYKEVDVNHYFQILLKIWQESVDWQELEPIDSIMRVTLMRNQDDTRYIFEKSRKAAEERYGLIPNSYARFTGTIRGGQPEYSQIRIAGFPKKNEQVWFLFSRVDGQILSTYKDTIRPFIRTSSAKDSIAWEKLQKDTFYINLLQQLKDFVECVEAKNSIREPSVQIE
jgi:hypothetical protein